MSDPPRLYGRGAELRATAAVTASPGTAGTGAGAVIVLTGAPGLGRTALLDHAARAFRGGPVLRVQSARSETRPPYGGVRAVRCAAAALRNGRNGRNGPPGAVPAAPPGPGVLLDLLRDTAADSPLLVCVDDVHLWDAASRAALGYAARRLHTAGPVSLLLTVAGHRAADPHLAGLPSLRLGPLPDADAGALLDELTGGRTDRTVRAELLDAAEGNPALLHALVGRLSAAELSGERALPWPLVDGEVVRGLVDDGPDGPVAGHRDLLLVAAAAQRPDPGGDGAHAELVFRALSLTRVASSGPPGDELPARQVPGVLVPDGDRLCFTGTLLREAVYLGARPDRRRAAHAALARAAQAHGDRLTALVHRALAVPGPAPLLADELAAVAEDPREPASPRRRAAALARAAELTPDAAARAQRRTAAAGHALHAGRPATARRLLTAARADPAPDTVRGHAELLHGLLELSDGDVLDAHESLLCAGTLLAVRHPAQARAARLAASDAAWAAGDMTACLTALAADAPTAVRAAMGTGRGERDPGDAGSDAAEDYRLGMQALLEQRYDQAVRPLRRVVERAADRGDPEALLRSAAAALLVGDVSAGCRAGARALAEARARGPASLVPRALEYLAYAELRAGRHARARAHAEEGLRAAHHCGQRNSAAHHRAVLALAASIEGEAALVAEQAEAALHTARRHGLTQAATLAEWALGRADLGRGRPAEAAARLGPLVGAGTRHGHFGVRMLAMPCQVEAAVLAGRPEEAGPVVEEFALWAQFGADPQAPAQLARCRALLAPPDRADALYLDALAAHDAVGGDFEQARTRLLYGKWLRRRRRLREARDRLTEALVAFERCGAGAWAGQARGELRATGAAPAGEGRVRLTGAGATLGERYEGMSADTVSMVLAVASFASLAGVLVCGLAVPRCGRTPLIVAFIVVEGLAKLVIAAVPWWVSFVASAVIWQVSFMALLVLVLSVAASADSSGRWVAAATGALAIGTALGPAPSGWVLDTWGAPAFGVILAVATAVAAVPLLRATRAASDRGAKVPVPHLPESVPGTSGPGGVRP